MATRHLAEPQPDRPLRPERKVTAGGLAGAVAIILSWVLSETTGVEVPPGVEAAITTVLTVGTAYLVPSR